jgi:predicted transcriptional regulator
MKPSDELRTKIYSGSDAQTASEIAKECTLSESTVRRYASDKVKSGEWKEVWVKPRHGANRGLVRAYIKVK